MKKLHKVYLSACLLAMCCAGCRKFVEVDPPIHQIIGDEIYKSDATANSVLIGIYTSLNNSFLTGRGSVTMKMGLYADELMPAPDVAGHNVTMYNNALVYANELWWEQMYQFVFKLNSAIAGLAASATLSPAVKSQLLGEARFMRAYVYFYLVNLYGDVPLLLSTDVKVNSVAPRAPVADVYKQMITDLKEAQQELRDDYVDGNARNASIERLRPNKAAAAALLSRVYLYTENWAGAEAEASRLINEKNTYRLESLETAFLKESHEAVWQFQRTDISFSTHEAELFVLYEGDGKKLGPTDYNRPVYMSKLLYNAFEPGDRRKEVWLDSVTLGGTAFPFAYKYKNWITNAPRTEHLIVLRLAEQYLIRAEARARQGNLTGANSAAADLDTLRHRAGLPPVSASTAPAILAAIEQERRVELFTELADRWFNLKRTGRVDEVMRTVVPFKGPTVTWEPYKALLPIPVEDLQINPSLKGHQNPGYPAVN